MAKTVVLTGGAAGIGRAAVERLLAAGCDMYVLDVLPLRAPRVQFVECDLADPHAIDAAIVKLPARIDVLVNVAGIATSEPPETVVAVNFLGLRHLTELLLSRVVDEGSIVNVASTAGRDWQKRREVVSSLLNTESYAAGLEWLRANRAEWSANPYKFAKQCVAGYTYRAAGLAVERRVRVNCVNPGSTETRLTPAFRDLVGPALYDWGVGRIGRHGTPAEVAEVIEFLAIGQCRWLNGVEIIVDGGYTAGIIGGWIELEESPLKEPYRP